MISPSMTIRRFRLAGTAGKSPGMGGSVSPATQTASRRAAAGPTGAAPSVLRFRWMIRCGLPAEVRHQQSDEEQVEQVVEGLRGKVVLPTQLPTEKMNSANHFARQLACIRLMIRPSAPGPAGPPPAPETQDRDQVTAACYVLGQRDQIEEAGPAEVRRKVGRRMPGPADVVNEAAIQ